MEHSSKSKTAVRDIEDDACHYVHPVRAEVFECFSEKSVGKEIEDTTENTYQSSTLVVRNQNTKQCGSQKTAVSAQKSSLTTPYCSASTEGRENEEGVLSGFSRENALAELRKILCMVDPQQLQLHADVAIHAHPPSEANSLFSSSTHRGLVMPILTNASCTPLVLPSSPSSSSSSFSLTEVGMRELGQLQKACQVWSDWCVERRTMYEEKIQASSRNATMRTESFSLGDHGGGHRGMRSGGLREEERKGEGKQRKVGVTALLFQEALIECFRFIQPSFLLASPFPHHDAKEGSETRRSAALSSSALPFRSFPPRDHTLRGTPVSSTTAFPTARAILQLPQLLLSNWRREAHEMLRLFQRLKEDEDVEQTKRREKFKKIHPEGLEGGEKDETFPSFFSSPPPFDRHSSSDVSPERQEGPTLIRPPRIHTPTSGSGSLPTTWDKSSAWLYMVDRRLQRTASFRSAVARLMQLLPLRSSGKAMHKTNVHTLSSSTSGADRSHTARFSRGPSHGFPRSAALPPQQTKERGNIVMKRRQDAEENTLLEPLQDEEEEEEVDTDDFFFLSATVFPFSGIGNKEETATSSSSSFGFPFSNASRYLSRLQLFAPLLFEAGKRREMMQVIRSHGIPLEGTEVQMKCQHSEAVQRDVDEKEPSVALLESWRNTLQEVHEKCIQGSVRQLHDNLRSIQERCKDLNILLEGI